jgi:lipopolysaccharide export system protein LptA
MCQNLKRLTVIFAFVLLSLSSAYALPEDDDKPIHINADSSMFDYKTGINTYEGNVKIDQGETHLTADRVTSKNNAQHKLEEATAYGLKKLAEYTTIPKPGDEVMHAQAQVIKFFPATSTVRLEGNVIVTQGKNSFQGPLIIYNMKDQTISAPALKGARATVVIEPKQYES